MENGLIREILNDLSAINRERAKAYEDASFENHIFTQELRATFALLANQSRQNNFMLRQHLERMPVKAASSKKGVPQLTFGELYNEWKNLSVSFTGGNVYEVLQSSEVAEETMLAIYTRAMTMLEPRDLKEMLESQFRGLQNSAGIVKGLANQPSYVSAQIKKSS